MCYNTYFIFYILSNCCNFFCFRYSLPPWEVGSKMKVLPIQVSDAFSEYYSNESFPFKLVFSRKPCLQETLSQGNLVSRKPYIQKTLTQETLSPGNLISRKPCRQENLSLGNLIFRKPYLTVGNLVSGNQETLLKIYVQETMLSEMCPDLESAFCFPHKEHFKYRK